MGTEMCILVVFKIEAPHLPWGTLSVMILAKSGFQRSIRILEKNIKALRNEENWVFNVLSPPVCLIINRFTRFCMNLISCL
jgi:hypothetical protein